MREPEAKFSSFTLCPEATLHSEGEQSSTKLSLRAGRGKSLHCSHSVGLHEDQSHQSSQGEMPGQEVGSLLKDPKT